MPLGKLAIGAALLSIAGILRIVIQFLTLPLIARMLTPNEFGVVAIALPFILFAQIFSDAGVGQSVIRDDPADREMWSTMFWVITIISVLIAAIIAMMAPVIAQLYAEPKLGPIVVALALSCVMQGMTIVPIASLQREGRFSVLSFADVFSSLTGSTLAVGLASMGFGTWALVAQQLGMWFVRLAVVWTASSFEPTLQLRLSRVGKHARFSRDIVTFNIINFFARSLDPLVIGKVLGPSFVAIYSVGYQMMRLPSIIVTGPIQNVFYSQVIRRHTSRDFIKKAVLFATRTIAIGVFPTMGLIAAAHVPLFRLLLTEKWAGSGTIFMLFSAAGAMQAVTGLNGVILMATGFTKVQIRFTAEFSTLWIFCLLVSSQFGLFWIPIAYTVLWFIYMPRFLRMFLSKIDCTRWEYVRTMVAPVALTIFFVSFYKLAEHYLNMSDIAVTLLVQRLILISIGLGGLFQIRVLIKEISEFVSL